jgi:serine/threonine-protein kinase PknG
MASCQRAGCSGTILDGYCDLCGHAAAVSAAVPAAVPAPAPLPAASVGTKPCGRPGCDGLIDDGYCNVCGLSVAATPTPAEPASAPSSHRAPAEATPCDRTQCGGVLEDGYCNVCGLAPSVPSKGTAGLTGAPESTIGSGPSQSTTTIRSGTGGSAGSGSRSSSSSRGDRGNLGAGLVEMPSVPARDPLTVVMTDPEVPERKRTCGRCDSPVGRSHDGRAARSEGFCPHCGAAYSFTPKLVPGDLVGGQYLVTGCIAHGGLGWVYLAQDKNLLDSWVVLKGLLDSNDESGMAAAIAERRFLVEVAHPNIVKIRNFVQHEDAGYIVMEYIGGESLREVRNRVRTESGAPLPVAQAIAYVLEILPAFGYLHRRGLLYCDFKPDNIIQEEEQLKLIDLGGVRTIDDEDSDLYGTVGYQAPEVPDVGASVSSDLYTVARTLAVLSLDLPGFQDVKRYATSLPPVEEMPLFARYESFHQFLKKATAPEPDARFTSAGEMADQLLGVLRQVLAIDGGQPPAVPSVLFSGELGPAAEAPGWQDLPVPTVDPFDPAAPVLAAAALSSPDHVRSILETAPRSPELAYQLARSWIEDGDFAEAERELESPEAGEGGWRVAWWRGVMQLAAERPRLAQTFFAAVGAELPGELAPKLAQAVAFELSMPVEHGTNGTGPDTNGRGIDERTEAAEFYGLVAATDPGFASASFGLSRVCLADGDRAGAASALVRIPGSSSAHAAAQIALCHLRCAEIKGSPPELEDLLAASSVLEQLRAEPSVRLPLVVELHGQALRLLEQAGSGIDVQMVLGGVPFNEIAIRSALEQTYRSMANLAGSDEERFVLVDMANASRPRSLT